MLLNSNGTYPQQIAQPIQWIYRVAAVLFMAAAGFQLVLGNTVASTVSLGVAACGTLGATVWLILRRLNDEVTRRATEDKMVKDIQVYLHNPENEVRPADREARQSPAPGSCGFKPMGSALQPEAPDAALVVLDAMPPRSVAGGDPADVFEKLEPLRETPML
jgi:hypothetical protein